jgi:hypothetical protein
MKERYKNDGDDKVHRKPSKNGQGSGVLTSYPIAMSFGITCGILFIVLAIALIGIGASAGILGGEIVQEPNEGILIQ